MTTQILPATVAAKRPFLIREGSPSRPEWDFADRLDEAGVGPLLADTVTTLQVNVGKLCNQACHHCHVDAGPKRTEQMDQRTAERIIELLDASSTIRCVDITGGAPELNPWFRTLVDAARERGHEVIDRCNLTVLLEPGMEDLAAFLADRQVHVIASLPCYGPDNVDKQRGNGVFDKSIQVIEQLNGLGYGADGSGLEIDLVYNPLGAFLPPDQLGLETAYREVLDRDFGLRFNHLLTLANLPISRFAEALAREGQLEAYMSLLVNHFNPATVGQVMCRSLISIGWDGVLYDCDFNQMLELPLELPESLEGDRRPETPSDLWTDDRQSRPPTIWDLPRVEPLADRPIATGSHCFGCTAGAGSSCGGALGAS